MIKESIKERIRTIARQLKLTTLIVTHDPEEALTLSDKVLIINGGRIAQSIRLRALCTGRRTISFAASFFRS